MTLYSPHPEESPPVQTSHNGAPVCAECCKATAWAVARGTIGSSSGSSGGIQSSAGSSAPAPGDGGGTQASHKAAPDWAAWINTSA